jgi:hypothetical protein
MATMTQHEAVEAVRAIALERGWRLREPVRVVTWRRGLAGRWIHVVVTTPDGRARRARVELDACTGAVLVADYGGAT